MIDKHGYRANVGIILSNGSGQVFWGKRTGQDAWQFPQGGIHKDESHEDAMLRELHEEVGLEPSDVEIIGSTDGWLCYKIPKKLIRWHSRPLCIGQKQRWFILRLQCDDSRVCLDRHNTPEFEAWKWVDYWHPPQHVVAFKRKVYCRALTELAPLMHPANQPQPEWVKQLLLES